MFHIKRTYDSPLTEDGHRILVDRLWPRGIKKEDLNAERWIKEVAPSTQLRKWFDHRVERWEEFNQAVVLRDYLTEHTKKGPKS